MELRPTHEIIIESICAVIRSYADAPDDYSEPEESACSVATFPSAPVAISKRKRSKKVLPWL
jgi:hypothetical protein